jgi:hypothetical protein
MSAHHGSQPIGQLPWLVQCRPIRDDFPEPAQRVGELFAYCSEPKAEMGRRFEAIAGCEQDAQLCGGLAKGAAILSPQQPGKCSHSATRRNPANRIAMFGHEGVKLAEIFTRGFLGFPEHSFAMAHRDFRQHFSSSVVCD